MESTGAKSSSVGGSVTSSVSLGSLVSSVGSVEGAVLSASASGEIGSSMSPQPTHSSNSRDNGVENFPREVIVTGGHS